MVQTAFKGKTVIITGASSGIGRELAHQLADQGAWLVLAARNVDAWKRQKLNARREEAKSS